MRTAIAIAHWTIRITGLIQILVGLLFWTNNALNLVPLHMLVGLILVLALWVLAVLAARTGVSLGLVALVALWGLILPVVGMLHPQWLPGGAHWVIEVIHLLIGVIAIGMGNRLATMSQQKLAPSLVA